MRKPRPQLGVSGSEAGCRMTLHLHFIYEAGTSMMLAPNFICGEEKGVNRVILSGSGSEEESYFLVGPY